MDRAHISRPRDRGRRGRVVKTLRLYVASQTCRTLFYERSLPVNIEYTARVCTYVCVCLYRGCYFQVAKFLNFVHNAAYDKWPSCPPAGELMTYN